MFFRKRSVTSPVQSTPTQTRSTVDLSKAQKSFDTKLVDLRKNTGVDLTKHRARVFVVIDRSGSMGNLYGSARNNYKGEVQNTLTRLLPIARRFDDNGELEVFVFNTDCDEVSPMTERNYENYVKQEIMGKGYRPTGGTNYAPVVRKTTKKYDDGSPLPAFGIVITDGENFDQWECDSAIKDSANTNIFYQFVGIGNEEFKYLEHLDDLRGRRCDNTAFVRVRDLAQLTHDELYQKLLEQYPQWLKAMRISL